MSNQIGWQFIDGEFREVFPTRFKTRDSFVKYSETGCLMLMDTNTERLAGVGKDYAFG